MYGKVVGYSVTYFVTAVGSAVGMLMYDTAKEIKQIYWDEPRAKKREANG